MTTPPRDPHQADPHTGDVDYGDNSETGSSLSDDDGFLPFVPRGEIHRRRSLTTAATDESESAILSSMSLSGGGDAGGGGDDEADDDPLLHSTSSDLDFAMGSAGRRHGRIDLNETDEDEEDEGDEDDEAVVTPPANSSDRFEDRRYHHAKFDDDPYWMETLAGDPAALENALREAVLWNDLTTVRTLLDLGGVSPQAIERSTGRTALWYAASAGSCESVRMLAEACEIRHRERASVYRKTVSKDALLNAPTVWGSTPILIAAACNRADTLETLLDFDVPVDACNGYGTTATLVAAGAGNTLVLDVLVRRGADLERGNNAGTTPVMIAARNGHVETLHYLNDYKVNFRKVDGDGMHCVGIACYHDRPEVIDCLSSIATSLSRRRRGSVGPGGDVDGATAPPPQPRWPDLNQPCGSGRGVDRDGGKDGKKTTAAGGAAKPKPKLLEPPLCVAVRRNNLAAVEAMVRSPHVDPSVPNSDGISAVFLAARRDNLEAARILCSKPEWVRKALNTRNGVGGGGGRGGAGTGGTAGAGAGAAIDASGGGGEVGGGMTPLYVAVALGHGEMTRLLAPLSDLGVLCGVGDNREPVLLAAARRDDAEAVTVLLRAGADVNLTDESGHTAVSIAARHGYAEVCELLLQQGADLSLRSKRGGGTPLQKARKYKHAMIVQILEKYSAGAGDVDVLV